MPWRSKPIMARSIAMWFCLLTIPKQSPPQLKPVVDADHGRLETHTATVSTEINRDRLASRGSINGQA